VWLGHLRGDLDDKRLAASIKKVIDSHPVLRSRFRFTDTGPWVQIVDRSAPSIEVRVVKQERVEALSLLRRFAEEPFDLSCGPLVRALIATIGPSEYLIGLGIDHIVCDGQSHDRILLEISEAYNGEVILPSQRAEESGCFYDLADAQRRRYDSEDGPADLEFWSTKIREDGLFPRRFMFARMLKERDCRGGVSAVREIPLDLGTIDRFNQLAGRRQATPTMGLLTATLTSLRKMSSDNRIAVVTNHSDRPLSGPSDRIGCFTSYVQVGAEIRPDENNPWSPLSRVRERMIDIFERGMPFFRAREHLGVSFDECPGNHHIHFAADLDDTLCLQLHGVDCRTLDLDYQLELPEPMTVIRFARKKDHVSLSAEFPLSAVPEPEILTLLDTVRGTVMAMSSDKVDTVAGPNDK
jgi:hypothetical protein